MASHVSHTVLIVAALTALGHSAAFGQPVRLRARTFVPPVNVVSGTPALAAGQPAPPAVARHVLMQFSAPIDAATLAALRGSGATPLHYVPDDTLSVTVPPGFNAAVIPGARWIGTLEPLDRLSAETTADLAARFPSHPLTVVEFHPDVDRGAIQQRLAAAGTTPIESAAWPARYALVPTDAAAIGALAQDDAVAWIFPAPGQLVLEAGGMCSGAIVPGGVVASFATVGDGWDGPGRGAAKLGHAFTLASADLDWTIQRDEILRAMEVWSAAVAVTWSPASPDATRTVRMFWAGVDHGDGSPFAPTELAHAFYPSPPMSEPTAGDIHFNDTLSWGAGDPVRWDVFSVALHELGHSLGLAHSGDPGDVMYPMYQGIVAGLAGGDIAAIRELYASADRDTLQGGWANEVIGADVGGGAGASEGRFTVSAGGRDIWGGADEFRFVSRTLAGNGDVIARVDALDGTHRWSKAGLMIRASRDPGAAHALVLVSQGRGLAFQLRATPYGDSAHTDGGPGQAPVWLWLSRRGARVEAYTAVDGGDWRMIGFDRIELGHEALVGLAVTNHDVRGLATATFSDVRVTPQSPWGWLSADIGAVGRAGSVVFEPTMIRVRGAGADIWGRADAFRFVWHAIEGDLDVVARITHIDPTREWTKAGVMIRAGLERGAAHAFMLGSAGKGYAFQRRPAADGISVHTSGGTGHVPGWVKLSRRGNEVAAYRSDDGRNWTMVGSSVIALGQVAFVGLAVSSHTTTAPAEARFESVTISQ